MYFLRKNTVVSYLQFKKNEIIIFIKIGNDLTKSNIGMQHKSNI